MAQPHPDRQSPEAQQDGTSPLPRGAPEDAGLPHLRNGHLVRVISRRGTAELPARATTTERPGTVFAPFLWGALWGERTSINRATAEAFDPRSKQPEMKFAAVRLEPSSEARQD